MLRKLAKHAANWRCRTHKARIDLFQAENIEDMQDKIQVPLKRDHSARIAIRKYTEERLACGIEEEPVLDERNVPEVEFRAIKDALSELHLNKYAKDKYLRKRATTDDGASKLRNAEEETLRKLHVMRKDEVISMIIPLSQAREELDSLKKEYGTGIEMKAKIQGPEQEVAKMEVKLRLAMLDGK